MLSVRQNGIPSMPYADPDKYREYQREYQRKWRSSASEEAKAKRRESDRVNRRRSDMSEEERERLRAKDRARRAANPEHFREKRRKQRQKYPERIKEQKKRSRFKQVYGITEEQLVEMLDAQDWKCANPGCRCDLRERWNRDKRWVHVDHCHDSGIVRGVLCNHCNVSFGTFGDNAAGLRLALQYLEQFEQAIASCTHQQLAAEGPGRRCPICLPLNRPRM